MKQKFLPSILIWMFSLSILIPISGLSQPKGDIWLHMLTTGQPASTRYLGDQLNPSGSWYIQFEVGQISWYQTDAGIGSDYMEPSTWTWRTANWFANGTGSNKQVQSDFGDFRFTQVGSWYFAGRAKGDPGDPFHYANSNAWGNAATLEPIYYFQVDAINVVNTQNAIQNSINPSTQIDLSWDKNAQSHNVMIVRKKVYESWTEPTQGTAYTAGNTIGSGVVVYNSSGISYTNTDLASSTDYDYKFYSVNNNYYSDGVTASIYTAFASGDGTSGNPYQVATADALYCVRHYFNSSMYGGNFIQTADINLSGVYASGEGWLPIDDLQGSYNGQGHTISNLTINRPSTDYIGLFSNVSAGIISNLGLINVNITGNNKLGAFAATLGTGSPPVIVQMVNCYSTGSVTVSSGSSGGWDVGGLVGYLRADINKCYSTCSVTNDYPAGWQYVGGLVGSAEGCTIKNSYATGAVSAAVNFYRAVGGLIGRAVNVTIEKCFATGLISFPGTNDYTFVDGIAGRFEGSSYYAGNFYDKETTGYTGMPTPGYPLSTAEMKTVGTFLAATWDFSSTGEWGMNGSTNSGYPYLRFQGAASSHIWLGTSTTAWATAGNWSENAVPSSDKTIIIGNVTNDPIISTTTEVANLTIETKGFLTIAGTGALTVSGTLTNNATSDSLIIESGGSLINSSTGVNATAKRDIPAANWSDKTTGWHLIASPVAEQVFQPNFVSDPPSAADEDFFLWDEVSNLWKNSKVGEGTYTFNSDDFGPSFIPGKGYLCAYAATSTKNFSGSLNVGNVNVSGLTLSTGTNKGYHLLGNPFASAVTWYTGWSTMNIGGVAYVWNGVGKSYNAINAGDPIPAGNGFMVQVSAALGSLTIPASKRVHSSQSWYKNSEYPVIKLIAHDISDHSFQETQVRINPESTSAFDTEFDGNFLAGYAPQFYSISDNHNLMVNSFPEITSGTSIPFHFIKNEGTDFSVEVSGLETLDPSTLVYLVDKKTGTEQNLTQTPTYSFTSSSGDDPARFELKFGTVGIENPVMTQNFNAWYSNGKLYVSKMEDKGQIRISNLQGQIVSDFLINAADLQTISLNLPAGIYVAQIVYSGNSQSVKIIVQ